MATRPSPSREPTLVNTRFRRAQRILRSSEFVHVMRVGQRFSRSAFAVHLCVTELGYPRLGIAVGRRVSLKANKRNTIKRIIRECFRHHAHALPSIDVVFNARPPALATTRKELANAVIGAMRHAERVATAEVTS